MTIHGGLMEAYLGYYEDDFSAEFPGVAKSGLTFEEWNKAQADKKIRADSPKRRLEIYLEWNGILGYANTVYEIATGTFEV